MNLPGPSYISNRLGSSENSEARQSTSTQRQAKNASVGIGYGADNLYGDETGDSGYLRPAYATVLKKTESETIAMRDCEEPCATPPGREQSRSPTPNLKCNSTTQKNCTCIDCLRIFKEREYDWYQDGGYRCHFPGCQTQDIDFSKIKDHEKSHYGQPGKYTCIEQSCHTITKNFGDLKRHDKAEHCTSPNKEQFPCPVLWCKYSGNNGFARKDKLKSHYKNIHEGKPGPVKAGRVIKPATLKPHVSGFGSSAGKQQE